MICENIKIERQGPIATVILDREEHRNALTESMLSSLEAVARDLRYDTQTRVVVFRSSGVDFSVGIDLKSVSVSVKNDEGLLSLRRRSESGARMIKDILDIPQPTICAISGNAVGGGACIAMACDHRLATTDARFGFGEVRLGMSLMWNVLPLCVRLIGPSKAKRLVMSGEMFPASMMLEWGIFDEICASNQLESRSFQWAEDYARLPPNAVQMIKRSVNAISNAMDQAIMHMDADQLVLTTYSEDFKEGMNAFMQKRKPEFTGR